MSFVASGRLIASALTPVRSILNNPPIDGLLLLGKVDADLYELSAIGGEGERVVFGVNLCQGFSGRLVVFELHDVDGE